MTVGTWVRPGASALAAGLMVTLGLSLSAPPVIDFDLGGREPIVLEGVHTAERMYARTARWTDGGAHLEWFGQFGVRPVAVELEVAPFFGRGGDQVEIVVGPRVLRHRLEADWHVVRVPTSGADAARVIDIRSQVHQALPDPRPLGIRLDRVSMVNGARGPSLGAPGAVGAALLVAIGALAWIGGHWLAGTGRWRLVGAPACALATGAILHLARGWLLTPSGVVLLAGASALATVIAVLLARPSAWSRPVVAAASVAIASAWLANAVVTSWYFVDVLRLDAWEAVPMVERALSGAFELADLWAPHNEHRPLTGRVVALGAALGTHWNHWWEFAALQLAAALTIGVLAAWAASLRGRWRVQPIVLVAAAAMLCATTQWENWLRGFSVHIVMGALAPMSALLVLSPRRAGDWPQAGPGGGTSPAGRWLMLAVAAALVVVGQLSFGAGLLVWPLGLLVLLVRGDARVGHLLAWMAAGAAAVTLYLSGLTLAAGEGARASTRVIGEGVLVAVAMPVWYTPAAFAGAGTPAVPAMLAMAGLAVLVWLVMAVRWWRQDHGGDGAWIFPTALAAFGLGGLALASFGRVSGGLIAMTASRYLGFAACFWAGLLLLVGLYAETRTVWARVIVRGIAGAAIVAAAVASAGALPYMDGEWHRVRRARAQLLRGDVGAAAVVLYPDPFKLERLRVALERHRLSVYRPGRR